LTCAIDGPRRKFDRTIEVHKDGTIDGFRRVVVACPDVSFHLLTRRGQPTFLEYIDRSSAGIAQASKRIEEVASDSIYSAFAFLEMRVSSWMSRKGFEIKGVKREGDKVRLDFHCKDDLEYDGWVDFLPDHQWVIDGWDITLKGIEPTTEPWRIVAAVTYGGDNPVPVLTGVTTTTFDSGRTATGKTVVEELSFDPVPASEFMLSHYGYDNRIGVADKRWLWPCIAVALVALWAFRKWPRN